MIGHDDGDGRCDLPIDAKGMQANRAVVVDETDFELYIPLGVLRVRLFRGDNRADLPAVVGQRLLGDVLGGVEDRRPARMVAIVRRCCGDGRVVIFRDLRNETPATIWKPTLENDVCSSSRGS